MSHEGSSSHRSATAYIIRRSEDGVTCQVELGDGCYRRLRHLVLHSPTGFDFGYAGSGPSDLARSLLADYLGDDDPAPAMYQDFKRAFLCDLRGQGPHTITAKRIERWLANRPVPA